MHRIWLFSSLALISVQLLPACLYAQNDQLVPVTYGYSVSKKTKKEKSRVQIRVAGDSAEIWGFNLNSVPKNIRSIRSKNPSLKIKRSAIRNFAGKSVDSTYKIVTDTSNRLRFRPPSRSNYANLKKRFISGSNSSSYFSNQWVRLLSIPTVSGDTTNYFETRGLFRKKNRYQFEMLPGAIAGRLPSLDPYNCSELTPRFFKLLKLRGYGLDKFTYTNFVSKKREVVRASFEIYFNVNSAEPDPEGLRAITDYLEKNHFEILNATMSGAASIEGDPVRNKKLQALRARVIAIALRKYNRNPIKNDTIMLVDTWEDFRNQLKTSPYAKLDTLDNETLLKLINKNDSLRKTFEPILKTQRKATLDLAIAKTLNYDERIQKLERDLNNAISRVFQNESNRREFEPKIMGMLDYLFKLYQQKELDAVSLVDILDKTAYSDYVYTLLGYHVMKLYEDGTYKKNGPITWEAYWKKYDLNLWFDKSRLHLNQMSSQATNSKDKAIYLKMHADFQAFTYWSIHSGIIDINSLCGQTYPNQPEFMGLMLNQYAFLYMMANSNNMKVDCMSANPTKTREYPKDSIVNTDKFLEELRRETSDQKGADQAKQKLRGESESGNQSLTLEFKKSEVGTVELKERPRLRPQFDDSPKSAYYFLLKQKFLKGNNSIMNFVEYTDGSGAVELDAFNLTHLIEYNLQAWKPAENFFYDNEIRLEELDKLISQLKKMDSHICRPYINELYLNYHLRALYYLERFYEPGNEQQTKIAQTSLSFITDYYKQRYKNVNSALTLHIIKQMNLFNWLPGSRPGARYGYELLSTIAKDRLLNDEELKLYAHYLKMYDPNLKTPLPVFYQKEKIQMLWTEAF